MLGVLKYICTMIYVLFRGCLKVYSIPLCFITSTIVLFHTNYQNHIFTSFFLNLKLLWPFISCFIVYCKLHKALL